jgi:hypothetical protein
VIVIVSFLPPPGELGRQLAAMANPIAAKRASDALYARDLASIRARMPRPPVEGTVDVYGNWQSIAIAYSFDYRPRPLFQSYIAYDAALAEMNAEHLRGGDAPQSILFGFNSIDHRYVPLDDALSWPEILRRYDPVTRSRDMMVLRKRAQPRRLLVTDTRTIRGRLGQPIAIPPSPMLWTEVKVETTMFGKLLAFAYKLPELRIAVDGSEGRFIRRSAGAGFLLSRARSLVIKGDGFYEPEYTVTLKELRLE